MHALAYDGVTVAFGSRVVLHGIDLRVAPGEVVAIAGANGAGKSTLLRLAASILAPSAGRVCVCDGDPLRAVRRGDVGWCSGDPGWTRRLTLRAALRFHAGLRGGAQACAESSIEGWAERLGFRDHLDLRAELCSSGIRQRAALARALWGRPRLLLLDEPLRGIDASSALPLAAALRDARAGAAVLWVSHDADERALVADREVRLDAGRVTGLRVARAA
jgi:ABC-type multidrug transport system ATPase subunit